MYVIITSSRWLAEISKSNGAKVVEAKVDKPFPIASNGDQIITIMNRFAFKPKLKGYDYLHFILDKCKNDPNYHHRNLTTEIYPECAKHFGTTLSRVERAVRHSIGVSYKQAPHMYKDLFALELKPTNGELISKFSKYLQYA